MNLVPALGQLQAQFGGHDSTAAVGRITGDADLHMFKTVPRATLSGFSNSMVGVRRGRSFCACSRPAPCMQMLAVALESHVKSGVELIKMRLEPLFSFFRQPGELNAHADSGIAGANNSGG